MELVQHLVSELGVTTRQAEGGAGLLLGFAQQRLSREDFVRLADTIPAISDVVGKAPRVEGRQSRPFLETLSRMFGGLGGLGTLLSGFKKLGCEKAMIPKFVESLTEFFRDRNGEEIEAMLQRVLR